MVRNGWRKKHRFLLLWYYLKNHECQILCLCVLFFVFFKHQTSVFFIRFMVSWNDYGGVTEVGVRISPPSDHIIFNRQVTRTIPQSPEQITSATKWPFLATVSDCCRTNSTISGRFLYQLLHSIYEDNNSHWSQYVKCPVQTSSWTDKFTLAREQITLKYAQEFYKVFHGCVQLKI